MKQKRKTILIFLLLLAIIPVILFITELRLPAIYSDSYYAELPELYKNLKSDTSEHKIVLIGGSNIAFGIDSSLLQECLSKKGYDYRVCPFGLYAAVGSSAMLDLSLDTLKEGDIVILSFEPISEAMSTYFGATAFLKCAESTPGLIGKLSKARAGAVIGNYPTYLQERYTIVKSGNLPKAEGAYSKAAFDNTGNMIYVREGNTMSIGYDISQPVNFSDVTISEDFAAEVSEYIEKASKKGVTVLYSFCPTNKSAVVEDSDEAVLEYYKTVSSAFPCRIISNPYSYLLDSGWFYDSNFHLNSSGARLRTLLLAEDLLAEFGCYDAVDEEFPLVPASMVAAAETTADTSFFTFESINSGNAYIISGLSDTGLNETSLTLPASYNGKPVAGFVAGAFDSSKVLEEIRIPDSIESIPDYAFSNCESLSRLILEHVDKPCKITELSLEYTGGIRIYVPANAYTYYRDGYGCEANQWTKYISQIYTY